MLPEPPDGDARVGPCRGCGGVMNLMGTEEFYVGGTSRVLPLFFGEWAASNQDSLPLELWVCASCRRVEMRVPTGYRRPPERARALRYACPNCGGDAYQGQTTCSSCGKPLPPIPSAQG